MAERQKVLERDWNDAIDSGTIKHIATGEVLTYSIRPELAAIATPNERRLILHGWHQKVGDNVAKTGDSPDDDFLKMAATHERVSSFDDWNKNRESAGPRPSMLLQAFFNVLDAERAAKGDSPIDDDTRKRTAAIATGADGKAWREKVGKIPAVEVEYEKLKIAAAQARLAAKTEAAAKAPTVDAASLLG